MRDATILAVGLLGGAAFWSKGESIPSPEPLPAHVITAAQALEDRTDELARQEADRALSVMNQGYEPDLAAPPPELMPLYRRSAEAKAREEDPEGVAAVEAVADHNARASEQNNKKMPWRRSALVSVIVGGLVVAVARREWPTDKRLILG